MKKRILLSLADHVADSIVRERHRVGLTQENVARRAALSQSHIASVERGVRSPSLEVIEHIANAMGIDPVKFFPRR